MNNIVQMNGRVIVNGIMLPPCPSKSKNTSSVIVGDKIYMNGYEFKHGEWKRTLAALLYNLL
jgi:hypothetical protein